MKLMTFLICLLSLLLVTHFKRAAGKWSIAKTSCDLNPKYAANAICTMKSKNRQEMLMSVGLTFISSLSNIQMKIKHFNKVANNRYTPGLVNVQGDLCEFTESINSDKPNLLKNAIVKFEPNFQTIYESILHPCPFKGPSYVHNITVLRVIDLPLLDIIPATGFKLDLSLHTGKGEAIYSWVLYYLKK